MSLYLTCRVSAQQWASTAFLVTLLGVVLARRRRSGFSTARRASLLGMEAPLVFRDKGQRAMDDMTAMDFMLHFLISFKFLCCIHENWRLTRNPIPALHYTLMTKTCLPRQSCSLCDSELTLIAAAAVLHWQGTSRIWKPCPFLFTLQRILELRSEKENQHTKTGAQAQTTPAVMQDMMY